MVNYKFRSFKETVKLDWYILRRFLASWRVVLATLLINAITLFFLLWLYNLDLLWNILTSSIGWSQKLDVISSTPEFLSSNYTPFQAALLVAFSLLQGLNLVLLIQVFRRANLRANVQNSSRSGLAALIALGGTGCAACGSSILSPLVASAGSGSLLWLESAGSLILLLGIGLLLYSIHVLLRFIPQTKSGMA